MTNFQFFMEVVLDFYPFQEGPTKEKFIYKIDEVKTSLVLDEKQGTLGVLK